MFGIGMPELIIIFVIALLIFGPKELPKIGKTIGKAMGEFRRASDDLREGIQREIDAVEREEQAPSPTAPEPVPAEWSDTVAAPEPPADTIPTGTPETPASAAPRVEPVTVSTGQMTAAAQALLTAQEPTAPVTPAEAKESAPPVAAATTPASSQTNETRNG